MTSSALRRICGLLLAVVSVVACAAPPQNAAPPTTGPDEVVTNLVEVFPGDGDIPGWTPDGEAASYDDETLFELVNGQADAFFAYNFQQVAVRSYTNDADNILRIEVWELASPTDAYGLFTRNVAGTPPVIAVGNDADADTGRRLAFWQDRFYVQVRAREQVDDSDIVAAAMAVSTALPAGGERPALIEALPDDARGDRGHIVFRSEISIQDEVWLGGENVLGLGPETVGVLAHYDIAGTPAMLLLVRYPDTAEAEAALERLSESEITELAAARVSGTLLAALCGSVDVETAGAWLAGLALEP